MKIQSVLLGEKLIRWKKINKPCWYIFTDGIFTGTDTNPRENTLLSYTIYSAFYDKENKNLWLCTNNGIGIYDKTTNTVNIIDTTASRSNNQNNQFVFTDGYILYHEKNLSNSYPVYVFDRNQKTLLRSIVWASGNYSDNVILQDHYYKTNYLFAFGSWYATTQWIDIRDWTGANYRDGSYHQAMAFGNKILFTCENGGNNGRFYSSPNDYIQSFTWNNMGIGRSSVTSTEIITQVKTTDFEYDKIGVYSSRGGTRAIILNYDWTVYKDSTWIWFTGGIYKYDNTYAFWWAQNGSAVGIIVYDKDNDTSTFINTWNRTALWITWENNLCQNRKWIYSIDGTTIYTNSSFITAIKI